LWFSSSEGKSSSWFTWEDVKRKITIGHGIGIEHHRNLYWISCS
jgi:hypothetical protein